MKIAVSTQDGATICGHLGKCRTFIVYEIDGGDIVNKGIISSGGACPGHGAHGHEHGHSHEHGNSGHKAHDVNPLAGCHAVITQGMGQGMMNALAGAGISPVITQLSDPDEAVRLYISGAISASTQSSCGCKHH